MFFRQSHRSHQFLHIRLLNCEQRRLTLSSPGPLSLDPPGAVTAAGQIVHNVNHRVCGLADLFPLELYQAALHRERIFSVGLTVYSQAHCVLAVFSTASSNFQKLIPGVQGACACAADCDTSINKMSEAFAINFLFI